MAFDPVAKAARPRKPVAAVGAAAAAVEPSPPAALTVVVEVPVHLHLAPYASDSVEVGRLRPRQAAALNFVVASLADKHERCDKGRGCHPKGSVVEGRPDAVRWLLDRVADAIEAATGQDLTKDFGLEFR